MKKLIFVALLLMSSIISWAQYEAIRTEGWKYEYNKWKMTISYDDVNIPVDMHGDYVTIYAETATIYQIVSTGIDISGKNWRGKQWKAKFLTDGRDCLLDLISYEEGDTVVSITYVNSKGKNINLRYYIVRKENNNQ